MQIQSSTSVPDFWAKVNARLLARGEKPYTEQQQTSSRPSWDVRAATPEQAALDRLAASFARQSASKRTGVALPNAQASSSQPPPATTTKDAWGTTFLNIKACADVFPRVRELISKGDTESLLAAYNLMLSTDPEAPGATELMIEIYTKMGAFASKSTRRAA